MPYNPDKEFNKNSSNGYYNNDQYAKSYTFYINPRFEIEKQVTLVVWVIDDIEKAKPFLFSGVEGANYLGGLQRQQDGTFQPFPHSGNKSLTAAFFNLPKTNPKNGNQLKDNNRWYFKLDTDPTKPNMSFETSSYYAIQERYDKGEEKEKSKPTNTDSYIDYALWTAETFYKGAIYEIPLSGEADLPKFKLPENDVNFTQTPQESEPPKDEIKVDENNKIVETPKVNGDFKFNVETSGTFTIVGSSSIPDGKLTIITDEKEWTFDSQSTTVNEELDEEYAETDTIIDGVEDPKVEEVVVSDVALQMMQQKEQEREQTESGSNSNSGSSRPEAPMPGGGSMTGKVNTDYKENGHNWGKVKKGMKDAELLKAMVQYIEGGYYYPAHAYAKFSEKDRNTYGSSGETLWGIDRCAGQTEKTAEGKAFWGEVDKLSGYGNKTGTNGYARKTNTRSWSYSQYPTNPSGWSYGHSPKPGDPGYDIMYKSFVTYADNNLRTMMANNFGNHPVKDLILNDSRFKFLWFRSTWNGSGWFSWYANGKEKKGIKGIKWAYDNVTKNTDELIIWDLNNRLKFGVGLITHDVKKMTELLGIKKGGGLA